VVGLRLTDGGGWSPAAGCPVPDGRYRPPGALFGSGGDHMCVPSAAAMQRVLGLSH